MSYETHVYIDFDGTIADTTFPHIHGVKPHARETIALLRSFGMRVHIFSCRVNKPSGSIFDDPAGEKRHAMEKFLEEHRIEHDGVWDGHGKPFGWIVDDKALRFEDNWREIGEFFTRLIEQFKRQAG